MNNLEDELDLLHELDRGRRQSATLRDDGLRIIWNYADKLVASGDDKPDVFEVARVVKALSVGSKRPPERLVAVLEELTLQELVHGEAAGSFSILNAALTLQALAAAPAASFSRAALVLFYWIVRELHTADAPDWIMGGARVGVPGRKTALMTSECVRAVLGFARAQDNTAKLITAIDALQARFNLVTSDRVPKEWQTTEMRRLTLAWINTVASLNGNLALHSNDWPDPSDVAAYLANVSSTITKAIIKAKDNFSAALTEIDEFRKGERTRVQSKKVSGDEAKRLERSETPHLIARRAVNQAIQNATNALVLPTPVTGEVREWQALATAFQEAADTTRRLLRPARSYLSSVLDRELAAVAGGEKGLWEPGELACAAASYGAISNDWRDARLGRAVVGLSATLSNDGRFPVGKPIHAIETEGRVSQYHASSTIFVRALAQLLEKTETVPIQPELVDRLLRLIEGTRAERPEKPSLRGWAFENAPPPTQTQPIPTAAAVEALARINRMLDHRINDVVYRHFSVKRLPALERGPDLESLFYPDHGLSCMPTRMGRESVGVILQRIRAHVLGLKSDDPLYSLVLHGPPGTGKTTIVEALALSCGVTLVEVTPSDIVVKGQEAIERRSRAVFAAIALLTRTVVLFDEFDPVLRRRDPSGKELPSVFSFLTPGLLPKLKTLHEEAKRRSVAYVLITNLVDRLDPAAIREGRFDRKIGIYPPDPLSRAGRFMSEFADSIPKRQKGELNRRIHKVIAETAGAGMQALIRKGWFRALQSALDQEGTPASYVGGGAVPSWPDVEYYVVPRRTGQVEGTEYREWTWIQRWDAAVKRASSLEAGLAAVPRKIPRPRSSGSRKP